jgi:hypothetical protein
MFPIKRLLPFTTSFCDGALVPMPTFPFTPEYWLFPLVFHELATAPQVTAPLAAIAVIYEPTEQFPDKRACLTPRPEST